MLQSDWLEWPTYIYSSIAYKHSALGHVIAHWWREHDKGRARRSTEGEDTAGISQPLVVYLLLVVALCVWLAANTGESP